MPVVARSLSRSFARAALAVFGIGLALSFVLGTSGNDELATAGNALFLLTVALTGALLVCALVYRGK